MFKNFFSWIRDKAEFYADFKIFAEVEKKVLQSNVIDRKVKESAVSHFDDYSKVFGL